MDRRNKRTNLSLEPSTTRFTKVPWDKSKYIPKRADAVPKTAQMTNCMRLCTQGTVL